MLTSPPPTEGVAHHDYRPHLDGLRAVAVYLVVAFHAEVAVVSGGFIGVDVFFVLSGYLVTQLLLRDLGRIDRIGLRRFYARRYRRLLPAAFLTLVVSAVAFVVVASAAEVADSVGAFRASFLYYANWHFIGQSADYFAADIDRSPVVHFWSLAVEEQFYLVWPLLLGGLFASTRWLGPRRTTVVRGIVALAALVSVTAALHISGTDLNRAYYGTDTRGYELLAGALLALTPRLFTAGRRMQTVARLVAVAAIASIVMLATSAVDLETIHRCIATTIATCALIFAIENRSSSAVTKGLSQPVATYLGRLSYGTYLWHWPVIVVLTRESSLRSVPLFAVTCAAATALASASYHAVELRVRLSRALDRYGTQVIAAGLTVSLAGGLVIAPVILDTKHGSTLKVASVNGVDPAVLDWRSAKGDVPPNPDCSLATLAACTTVRGSGRHILLLGDSNARMYIPTFTKIAERERLTLSVAVTPLCPWQLGLTYLRGTDACNAQQREWYGGLVGALHPDVIVVVDRPMDDPANAVSIVAAGRWFTPSSKGYDKALRDLSQRSLARLQEGGRKVVIIEPIPIATKEADPLVCLSSAQKVEDCIYRANAVRTPLEAFYASAVRPGAVWSLDVDRLVCPRLPVCDPVVNGIIVKRDSDHITGTFASEIADGLDALLQTAGVLR